jgi:hypothetical protein
MKEFKVTKIYLGTLAGAVLLKCFDNSAVPRLGFLGDPDSRFEWLMINDFLFPRHNSVDDRSVGVT